MVRENLSPEGGAGKSNPIESLRLQLEQLQGMKAEKAVKKQAKRRQVISETADMAVGNKRLSSMVKRGDKFGAGYKEIESRHQEAEEEATGAEEKVKADHQAAKQRLAELKLSIAQELERADEADKPKYEDLLKQAEAQEKQLELEFTNNLNQARWRGEKAKSSRKEAAERHAQFAKEQETAAQDPYSAAAEAVIISHKENPEDPNDFSGEKDQIEQEAKTIGDEREALEEARENFPKMQQYADRVEGELAAAESQLRENFAKAEAAVEAYFKKFNIKKFEQIINELKEKMVQSSQGLFKRQKTRDAEWNESWAGLAAVAKELDAMAEGFRLNDFYDVNFKIQKRLHSSTADGGDLSETAFSINVDTWRLQMWQKFAEKNLELFGSLAEEISAFQQRIERIKSRRYELYQLSMTMHNGINEKIKSARDPFLELSRKARIRP